MKNKTIVGFYQGRYNANSIYEKLNSFSYLYHMKNVKENVKIETDPSISEQEENKSLDKDVHYIDLLAINQDVKRLK